MNVVSKGNGWRSLAGILGVGVLALGISLKLEGAPPNPRAGQSGDRSAPVVAREATPTIAETVSAGRAPAAVSAQNPNRASREDPRYRSARTQYVLCGLSR